VDEEILADEKGMKLRYPGTCRVCSAELPAKTEALYERSTKTIRCIEHGLSSAFPTGPNEAIDPGIPGASARREFERRHARREQRIRAAHPKLGGLIHALTDDPPSTKAWDTGALGEEQLGHRLDELSSERLRVLHDCRVPGTRTTIDHLAVTPSGVHVIDTKKYTGRPHVEVHGGVLSPRIEKLFVGKRNRTKLLDGVLGQLEASEAWSARMRRSWASSASWERTGRSSAAPSPCVE
jgi:Nuclease-related domain